MPHPMNPHYLCPDLWTDRPLTTVAELALFCRGSDDSLTGDLIRLMRKADIGNRHQLAMAFPHVDRALTIWENTSPTTFGALMHAVTADPPPDTVIRLRIADRIAELLAVLVDPESGYPDLQSVIMDLIDHVQQGIYRPGSWERGWLQQAMGYGWTDKLEPDPDSDVDGRPVFERPIRPADSEPA